MSEPQYAELKSNARHTLGAMSSHTYEVDAKRLGFTLARYKFVARVLAGCDWVLEIGCGDAFATRIVAQAVGHVMATDFDAEFIDDARSRQQPENVFITHHDMAVRPLYKPDSIPKCFDAAYALDVLEHIQPHHEGAFLSNVALSIGEYGTFICGSFAGVAAACVRAQPSRACELQDRGRAAVNAQAVLQERLRLWDE